MYLVGTLFELELDFKKTIFVGWTFDFRLSRVLFLLCSRHSVWILLLSWYSSWIANWNIISSRGEILHDSFWGRFCMDPMWYGMTIVMLFVVLFYFLLSFFFFFEKLKTQFQLVMKSTRLVFLWHNIYTILYILKYCQSCGMESDDVSW